MTITITKQQCKHQNRFSNKPQTNSWQKCISFALNLENNYHNTTAMLAFKIAALYKHNNFIYNTMSFMDQEEIKYNWKNITPCPYDSGVGSKPRVFKLPD